VSLVTLDAHLLVKQKLQLPGQPIVTAALRKRSKDVQQRCRLLNTANSGFADATLPTTAMHHQQQLVSSDNAMCWNQVLQLSVMVPPCNKSVLAQSCASIGRHMIISPST
jgi:hypothetical protein